MSFIKYIADENHYKEVLSLVEKAKRTVWIGYLEAGRIGIEVVLTKRQFAVII